MTVGKSAGTNVLTVSAAGFLGVSETTYNAALGRAFAASSTAFIPQAVTGNVSGNATIPSGSSLSGPGSIGLISSGSLALSSDASLKELAITGTAGPSAVSLPQNASRVVLDRASIGTVSVGITGGDGVDMLHGGNNYTTIRDSVINSAAAYGLLTGSDAAGSATNGLCVLNSTIIGVADAVEFNSPNTAQTNTLLSGCILEAAGSYHSTAGFSIGAAHNNGFVWSNFISLGSTQEALHIEDGSSLGVVSSFVVRNAAAAAPTGGNIGIRHVYLGPNQASSGPVVFTGFCLEGSVPGSSASESIGYFASNAAAQGAMNRSPLVAGYVLGFESVMSCEGVQGNGEYGLLPIGYLSAENCYYGARLSDGAIAPSSLMFSKGMSTFLQSNSGNCHAGTFHEESSVLPSLIVNSGGAASPGCSIEGFSEPCYDAVIGSATYGFINLFPVPALLSGVITVSCVGLAGWFFWEANVVFTGSGVTISNAITKSYGDVQPGVASGTAVIYDANFMYLGVVTTAAETLKSRVKFRGTYFL